MELALIDILVRLAIPCLIGWNVYLFKQIQNSRDQIHRLQLHVAKSYTSKDDLEKMLERLEQRLEKQLNNFFNTITKG